MGIVSGYVAQYAGYTVYFWLTVALGIPGVLLLPTVREPLRIATQER